MRAGEGRQLPAESRAGSRVLLTRAHYRPLCIMHAPWAWPGNAILRYGHAHMLRHLLGWLAVLVKSWKVLQHLPLCLGIRLVCMHTLQHCSSPRNRLQWWMARPLACGVVLFVSFVLNGGQHGVLHASVFWSMDSRISTFHCLWQVTALLPASLVAVWLCAALCTGGTTSTGHPSCAMQCPGYTHTYTW